MAVVSNCANTHVWDRKNGIFPGSRCPCHSKSEVTTIGGTNHYPTEVCKLEASWKDDEGKTQTCVIQNVLLFPSSPVKVISVDSISSEFVDKRGSQMRTAPGF